MKYPIIFLYRLVCILACTLFIFPLYILSVILAYLWDFDYKNSELKKFLSDPLDPLKPELIKGGYEWIIENGTHFYRQRVIGEYKNIWHYIINKKTLYEQ